MFQKVKLTAGGFTVATTVTLVRLEVAVGERTDATTELFVRGQAKLGSGARVPFAGCTILREGRDAPTHDLQVMGHPARPKFLDDLAMAVHLALDAHAEELVTAEMDRICS